MPLATRPNSPAVRAEAVLAAHQPVPQWAVEGVLLSRCRRTWAPRVLKSLDLEDGAAATCVGAAGWRAVLFRKELALNELIKRGLYLSPRMPRDSVLASVFCPLIR